MSFGPYTFYAPPVRLGTLGLVNVRCLEFPDHYSDDTYLSCILAGEPPGVAASACPSRFAMDQYIAEAQRLYPHDIHDPTQEFPPNIGFVIVGTDLSIFVGALEPELDINTVQFWCNSIVLARWLWLCAWHRCAMMMRDAFRLPGSKGGSVATENPP